VIPAEQAREVVLSSIALTSLERMAVYRDMYLMRMADALEVDYPCIAKFLGADRFAELVARYVDVYPSRSYTLNRLGDHLPEFIAASGGLYRNGFLYDLARLELALTQAFDAQETPPVTPEAIAAVPQDAWENARMRPIAALRLLELDYPASAYVGSVLEETDPPSTRKKKTWVAAYRRDYGMRRLDLSRPAFELLRDLVEGKPVGEAIITACTRPRGRSANEEQLFTWFQEWMAEGLFRAIEVSNEPSAEQ
jgi:hypothetical protein